MIKVFWKFLSSARIYWRFAASWRKVIRYNVSKGVQGRVLIVPADPWSVVGSRGDQAMVLAVKQHCGAEEIDILTDSHQSDVACYEIGLNPLPEWNASFDVWMRGAASKYKEVYIFGADVTDGVYGWPTAMKLLMFYDCFSRLGIKTHYLGFSWSETPSPWMHLVFPLLKRRLPLLIRDPVSYARIARFTRHRPLIQVADVAFQLKPNPTPRAKRWIEWCRGQKRAGRRVVAINIHQMFNDAETKSADWEVAFSKCLEEVAKHHLDVTYLLVPHDNRPRVSDLEILMRVRKMLSNSMLIDTVMNADEIKAVIGECDALIAGRMHISIAALGQGVPVFGLGYQGKFEGLWANFGLPKDTLIQPKLFLGNSMYAQSKVADFLAHLYDLRVEIKNSLTNVLSLSERNFNG